MGGVERTDVVGGRYRLDHLLGRGGMGAVWAGHDTILNRPVAVKMLRDDEGPNAPLLRQRLLAEARSAAAVRHPNLVSTFDAVSDGGTFALVMERLPGPSLADRLADGPLTASEARAVALDVLGGLDAVHQAGLVHRDVKPANVLRSADGRWMLVDFGIAKNLLGNDDLTLTGTTVGTPAYLAPEQLHGRQATANTDLWAVGVMLYEALSGRLPFSGETSFAVAYSVQTDTPEPLSTLLPDPDPAIVDTIERALRKSPEDRFESAPAMASSLRPRPVDGGVAAPIPQNVTTATDGTTADDSTADDSDVTGVRGVAGVDDGPVPVASRRPVLVLSLVVAALIAAVVTGLTLGGGADDTDTAPVSPTSEASDGNATSAPSGAAAADGDTATSGTGTRATGTGSRRSTGASPAEPIAEDTSVTTPPTTTSEDGSTAPPTSGSPDTSPPSTPPPTTTTTTAPPPTTEPPLTIPPLPLPEITLPHIPPGLVGTPPGHRAGPATPG